MSGDGKKRIAMSLDDFKKSIRNRRLYKSRLNDVRYEGDKVSFSKAARKRPNY